jgi:hypothetical protein
MDSLQLKETLKASLLFLEKGAEAQIPAAKSFPELEKVHELFLGKKIFAKIANL